MDAGSLLMLVAVMVIFYFVLVRPQKRRFREHQQLISTLTAGDEVVTIGGVYGYVQEVEDDLVWLEVADGVELRFSKQAISRRISPEDTSLATADEALGSAAVEPAGESPLKPEGGTESKGEEAAN
jgi:preprotein translocase subunit YajC